MLLPSNRTKKVITMADMEKWKENKKSPLTEVPSNHLRGTNLRMAASPYKKLHKTFLHQLEAPAALSVDTNRRKLLVLNYNDIVIHKS